MSTYGEVTAQLRRLLSLLARNEHISSQAWWRDFSGTRPDVDQRSGESEHAIRGRLAPGVVASGRRDPPL
jgi:hypothetical protein